MMKSLKGFTLVECIVAMAVIGLTSLLMVQVYGTVAVMNRDNINMNNSIERQMEYAERRLTEAASAEDSGKVTITKLTHSKTGASLVEKIKWKDSTSTTVNSKFHVKPSDIEAEFDLYVLGIDSSANGQSKDEYGREDVVKNYDDNNVRYKFIIPSSTNDLDLS